MPLFVAPLFVALMFALHVYLGLLTLLGVALLALVAFAQNALARGASDEAARRTAEANDLASAARRFEEAITPIARDARTDRSSVSASAGQENA